MVFSADNRELCQENSAPSMSIGSRSDINILRADLDSDKGARDCVTNVVELFHNVTRPVKRKLAAFEARR